MLSASTCQEGGERGDSRVVEGDGGRELGAKARAEAGAQLHSTYTTITIAVLDLSMLLAWD